MREKYKKRRENRSKVGTMRIFEYLPMLWLHFINLKKNQNFYNFLKKLWVEQEHDLETVEKHDPKANLDCCFHFRKRSCVLPRMSCQQMSVAWWEREQDIYEIQVDKK